jgi:hypothetical protein
MSRFNSGKALRLNAATRCLRFLARSMALEADDLTSFSGVEI